MSDGGNVAGLSRELLQDSEVTLRLVDDLVEDLAIEQDGDDGVNAGVLGLIEQLADRRAGSRGVDTLLLRMYAELQRILYNVRRSRGLLEEATLTNLENTNAKLLEVSSTTEFAAVNMLDGVDRALAIVDRVQQEPGDAAAFDALRDELHALVTALQFQDIISQQLDHASTIIAEMEGQLRRVTRLFAESVLIGPDEDGDPPAFPVGAFDPAATVDNAATRQALADDIFGG